MARGHAVGQHLDDLVVLAAGQLAERIGAADEGEQIVLAHVLGGGDGHHLLGDDVEGMTGDVHLVELTAAHGPDGGGRLHQLVTRECEHDALGESAQPVAGAPDALQQRVQRARRAQVDDEVDVSDVDAQLERRGGHHHRDRTRLESLLGFEADGAREAAVVGRHLALAEAGGELVGHAFDQASGVDEHQSGAVSGRQLDDAVVDLVPHLVAGDGPEGLRRHLDRQVPLAPVPGIDDRNGMRRAEERGDSLDRLLGGGEADALQGLAHQTVQSLERQREVGAALVAGHGMDLVDDHGAGGAEVLTAALRREQDEQRLRGGDEDVGWPLDHGRPLRLRSVAAADLHADLGQVEPLRGSEGADGGQRLGQVLLDVVPQRLERRDVDDGGAVLEPSRQRVLHQAAHPPQEGSQGLARAGGRGHQRVPAGGDVLPALLLRGGGWPERGGEPAGDEGVEARRSHRRHCHLPRRHRPVGLGISSGDARGRCATRGAATCVSCIRPRR